MNKKSLGTTRNMTLHTRNKLKSLSCSTPENKKRVPSSVHEDSSPLCGSDADSPVPFLCTQDGGADTDVVWNYYTPKAEKNTTSPSSKDTPLSRKGRRIVKRQGSVHHEVPTKKKVFKASQKKIDLFKDLKAELLELNENVQGLLMGRLKKDEKKTDETKAVSNEEDIFNDSFDRSQQNEKVRSNTRNSLRKNVLSTKFPIDDYAIESDDSINECLLKASQMVEERVGRENNNDDIYSAETQNYFDAHELSFEREFITCGQMTDLSKMISPAVNKSIVKTIKHNSPAFSNDSFENILCNMNDSDVERLSQMPPSHNAPQIDNTNYNNKDKQNVFTFKKLKSDKSSNDRKSNNATKSINIFNKLEKFDRFFLNNGTSSWSVNDSKVCDTVPSPKSAFGRHNSMPESPRVPPCKPSTSATVLSRHNSMPQTCDGDSPPMKCTPDEIKRKHRLAREKLLAKRILPFTTPNKTPPVPEVVTQLAAKEKNPPKVPSDTKFQFKVKTANGDVANNIITTKSISTLQANEINKNHINNSYDKLDTEKSNVSSTRRQNVCSTTQTNKLDMKDQNLKAIIERKRTDAMLKLKRKRSQNNFPQ